MNIRVDFMGYLFLRFEPCWHIFLDHELKDFIIDPLLGKRVQCARRFQAFSGLRLLFVINIAQTT